VVGVDQQEQMLAQFAAAAQRRGVAHAQVLGDWPAVAALTEDADVVVCHHVAYNVPDLGAFALALHAHARRRVVVELRAEHPMVLLRPLWRQFWNVDRPAGPTADDALAVLREVGLPARRVRWQEPPELSRVAGVAFERQVEITRIRLCLPADRDPEVAAALQAQGAPPSREIVTIWWDPPDGAVGA